MTRAVIYARYSSAGQRDESIEGQIRDCTYYCQQNGFDIVGTYPDKAVSGTTDKRPNFQQMISDAQRHKFDVVVCWKVDRFARNRFDAAFYKNILKKNNVKLCYAKEAIPDEPMGIVLESMMEGYAEFYSANLSQNVKRGNYDSALKRQTLGVKVFGLKENSQKQYEINEEQAVWVRYMYEEVIKGTPYVRICEQMNAAGMLSTAGHPFSRNSVSRMIQNEKYKGVYKYKDEIRDENGIPAIVSPEVWQHANDKLQTTQIKKRHNLVREVPYMLTGKLFCGHCGGNMVGDCVKKSNGKIFSYYACGGRKIKHTSCQKKRVKKEVIEDKVINTVWDWLNNTEAVENFAEYCYQSQFNNNNTAIIETLENRLKQLNKEIDNLVSYICKFGGNENVAKQMKEAEEQKAVVEDRLAAERFRHSDIIPKELILDMINVYTSRDYPTSPAAKEKLIDTFVNKVIVYDDYFDLFFNAPGFRSEHISIPDEIEENNNDSSSDKLTSGGPFLLYPNRIRILL